MLIFAITTSTRYMSMSLYKDNEYISDIKIKANKTHSKNIVEQISLFFEWNNINIQEIDTVIISKGPGSFTGIRVAMSFIKGAFLDTKAKFYILDEFEVYEYKIEEYNNKIILIDGQKEKIYTKIDNEYKVLQLDELLNEIKEKYTEVTLIGDALLRHQNKISAYFRDNNIIQNKISEFDNYIDTKIYIKMYLENRLDNHITTLEAMKPNYFEKMLIKTKY